MYEEAQNDMSFLDRIRKLFSKPETVGPPGWRPNSILLVPPDVDPGALTDHMVGGPMPLNSRYEDIEVWKARGRVSDCDCQLLQCVCTLARPHKKDCRWRIANTCAIPIPCEAHGLDACPECDPCTCGAGILTTSAEAPAAPSPG